MAAPNWKNRTLFHGDNLEFLRAMNSESVDLIATDPPFNKSRDFHATPDSLAAGASFQDRWSWEKDVHQRWKDKIKDDYRSLWEIINAVRHAHSDGMGAYLCFMAVRLLAMRRILKPTGAIYLHCDPTASHYLKMTMDAIFGRQSFKNEIIWRRTSTHSIATSKYGPIHDVILFYAMENYQHNVVFAPYSRSYVENYFKKSDSKGKYRERELLGSRKIGGEGESRKPWRGFDPTKKGNWSIPRWLVSKYGIDPELSQHKKLDALLAADAIDIDKNFPTYRHYLADCAGVPLQDVWAYQPGTAGFLEGTEDEIDKDVQWVSKRNKNEIGYPTQKPVGLYSRIIRASSNEGDVVLDPFAGGGTTLEAAELLNRQWVGVDIWDKAHETVVERLERASLIYDVNYETEIPERTDDGETAAPSMRTVKRRLHAKESWQQLSREQMFDELADAQRMTNGLVVCAGCGRELEKEFMELDHITPKSDRGVNDISNRILLCRPCNGKKSNDKTMPGLIKQNRKDGWMQSEERAKNAQDLARERYEYIRYGD